MLNKIGDINIKPTTVVCTTIVKLFRIKYLLSFQKVNIKVTATMKDESFAPWYVSIVSENKIEDAIKNFEFLSDFKKNKIPANVRVKETFASQAPREKWMCQGLMASNNAGQIPNDKFQMTN